MEFFSDLKLIFWIFLWNKSIKMTPTLLVSAFVVALLGQATFVQVEIQISLNFVSRVKSCKDIFRPCLAPHDYFHFFLSFAISEPMTHLCETEKKQSKDEKITAHEKSIILRELSQISRITVEAHFTMKTKVIWRI